MPRPTPMVRRGGTNAPPTALTRSATRSAGPAPSPTGLPVKFLDNHETRRLMSNSAVLEAVPALRNFDLTTKAACCTEAKQESDQIAASIRQFIANLPAGDKQRLKAALKVQSVQLTYRDNSGTYTRDSF